MCINRLLVMASVCMGLTCCTELLGSSGSECFSFISFGFGSLIVHWTWSGSLCSRDQICDLLDSTVCLSLIGCSINLELSKISHCLCHSRRKSLSIILGGHSEVEIFCGGIASCLSSGLSICLLCSSCILPRRNNSTGTILCNFTSCSLFFTEFESGIEISLFGDRIFLVSSHCSCGSINTIVMLNCGIFVAHQNFYILSTILSICSLGLARLKMTTGLVLLRCCTWFQAINCLLCSTSFSTCIHGCLRVSLSICCMSFSLSGEFFSSLIVSIILIGSCIGNHSFNLLNIGVRLVFRWLCCNLVRISIWNCSVDSLNKAISGLLCILSIGKCLICSSASCNCSIICISLNLTSLVLLSYSEFRSTVVLGNLGSFSLSFNKVDLGGEVVLLEVNSWIMCIACSSWCITHDITIFCRSL